MTISICLTTLGTLSQSAFVNIYSNLDTVTPIYTNIPVSSLFGANCSFIATIPDGSSSILLQQVDNLECFINLSILTSDFCDVCNLRFDILSSTTVGIPLDIINASSGVASDITSCMYCKSLRGIVLYLMAKSYKS